jgi:hypothetical protein
MAARTFGCRLNGVRPADHGPGRRTEVLERPHGKDIEVQQVLDIRRMLAAAGFHGDAGTGEP